MILRATAKLSFHGLECAYWTAAASEFSPMPLIMTNPQYVSALS